MAGKRNPAFEGRSFGPPSNPRHLNFYGHFSRGAAMRQFRINQAHEEALVENERRKNAQ